MADLTEQQSAQTVKITGSSSSGVEDNYLAVDASGRITVNQGLAGAANWLINLAAFGGTAVTLGQATMSASIPVTLASNQSTLPISIANGTYGGQIEGRAAAGAAAVGNPVQIGGLEGSTIRSIAVDSIGRIVIAGASTSAVSAGFRMGYVTTASTTTVPVCATSYTEQTTNAQRSIVSANAADTAAGTGARTVRITYLTATFTGPFTEDITLNGTTPVNTVATNICYVERLEVLTAGSGGVNAGIISLRTTTGGGGSTFISIAAGDNRTFCTHHYTPTGFTTYITSLSTAHNGTTTGSGGLFVIRSKALNVTNAVEKQVTDFHRQFGQAGTTTRNYGTPIEIVGPAVSRMWVTPEGSGTVIFRSAFDYYDQ